MNPIPQKLRNELSEDPYYKKCCLTKSKYNVKFHHSWIYAGKQINEKWAIMPVIWRKHSPYGDDDSIHKCQETKEYVQYLSLQRADIDDLCKRLPKKDWRQLFNYLENKYKNYDKRYY